MVMVGGWVAAALSAQADEKNKKEGWQDEKRESDMRTVEEVGSSSA